MIEVYSPSKTLTFILTDQRTIVKTPHQTFYIKYDHRNYAKQLEELREMIRRGEMNNIVDLITYCKWRPGNNRMSQNYGLELVATKLERHINV